MIKRREYVQAGSFTDRMQWLRWRMQARALNLRPVSGQGSASYNLRITLPRGTFDGLLVQQMVLLGDRVDQEQAVLVDFAMAAIENLAEKEFSDFFKSVLAHEYLYRLKLKVLV